MNSFIVVSCIIVAAYAKVSQSKQIAACPKIRPMENLEISKKVKAIFSLTSFFWNFSCNVVFI